MFANIASKRQFPFASFNIPVFNPRPCLYALEIALFRSVVVILLVVFISKTSCGVSLLLSILVLVFLFSLLVSQFPVFPCVSSSLFVVRDFPLFVLFVGSLSLVLFVFFPVSLLRLIPFLLVK